MAQIDRIVQLFITRQTARVEIASFDIPLLMVEMDDSDAQFTDRVRTYTSLEGVGDDLGVNHPGYTMASQLLGGDIRPVEFKIGKVNKQAGSVETYPEAIAAVQEIDDTWYAVITQSHLDSDILAVAQYIQPQRKIYVTSTSSQLALQQTQVVDYTATVQFDLTGAANEDTVSVVIAGERYESEFDGTDWGAFAYVGQGAGTFDGTFSLAVGTGLLTVENDIPYVVTSARQVFGGVTEDISSEDISATIPVGMDIGQRLNFMGYDRTSVIFSNTADAEWPEAAWVGPQIVEVPGSNTWEYKALAGVTPSSLNDSQINLLETRGYNYYIRVRGLNIVRRGQVAEGSWIDEIVLVDWIYARIQEQIFFRLANTRKIPYTNAGATIIENEIRSVLAQGATNGGIDTFNVTSPLVLSIPENQRNARIMGDFRFEARLAGAVSVVVIRGVVSA